MFGGSKKSNLYKFLLFSSQLGIWIRSFENVVFNFINVKDVAQAVLLTISYLKVSKIKYILFQMIVDKIRFIKNTKTF